MTKLITISFLLGQLLNSVLLAPHSTQKQAYFKSNQEGEWSRSDYYTLV